MIKKLHIDNNIDPKIVLISPPFEIRPASGITPPLGLCYIASYLRKINLDPRIIDLASEITEIDLENLPSLIRIKLGDEVLKSTLLIGIGPLLTSNLVATAMIVDIIKQKAPDAHITVGGPLCAAQGFQKVAGDYLNVDSFIVGEGEHPIANLFWALTDGQPLDSCQIGGLGLPNLTMPSPYRLPDINTLPLPARDLVPNDQYFLSFRRRINQKTSSFAILRADETQGNRIIESLKKIVPQFLSEIQKRSTFASLNNSSIHEDAQKWFSEKTLQQIIAAKEWLCKRPDCSDY